MKYAFILILITSSMIAMRCPFSQAKFEALVKSCKQTGHSKPGGGTLMAQCTREYHAELVRDCDEEQKNEIMRHDLERISVYVEEAKDKISKQSKQH